MDSSDHHQEQLSCSSQAHALSKITLSSTFGVQTESYQVLLLQVLKEPHFPALSCQLLGLSSPGKIKVKLSKQNLNLNLMGDNP